MWLGDVPEKPQGDERSKLLEQRKELVKKIQDLKATPLPRGDKEQLARFRAKDLQELAVKVVKLDKKLGRIAE
jgi:hypothetical protein